MKTILEIMKETTNPNVWVQAYSTLDLIISDNSNKQINNKNHIHNFCLTDYTKKKAMEIGWIEVTLKGIINDTISGCDTSSIKAKALSDMESGDGKTTTIN